MREIKIEITQIKSNIVELKEEIIDKYSNLKSEMVELKSAIEIELNSFKASVQSDMTEIKSMLCQFGAIWKNYLLDFIFYEVYGLSVARFNFSSSASVI